MNPLTEGTRDEIGMSSWFLCYVIKQSILNIEFSVVCGIKLSAVTKLLCLKKAFPFHFQQVENFSYNK